LFADVVDGFYTNYNWTKDHLKQTKHFLELQKPSIRPSDVYFGVDVFGRGSFGGGQFNTHIAVQAVRNYGFSIAIFAPGWTSECFEKAEDALANHDNLFRPMCDTIYPHRLTRRSFETNFDLGIRGLTFDPLHRRIMPFLLESDMRLNENGLVIHGAKGTKHV
jgi:mannosyl-glycoprotein endo-beta-N-acetylglucosaminidase